jgi:NADPH:quinone reductase
MKAICVTPNRELEVRDIPTPNTPAPGHLLIDMEASAINHGDKAFLRMPTAAGNALARSRNIPAIFLVRTPAARDALSRLGVENVIVTHEGFNDTLGALSTELGTTAVFDGVGGDLLTRIAPSLPMNSTIYCYGFLGGAAPISIQSVLFMMKNLSMKRFSNFESRTVKEQAKLVAALKTLEGVIDDPMFMTRIGKEFRPDQIELAMAYGSADGAKAVLVT